MVGGGLESLPRPIFNFWQPNEYRISATNKLNRDSLRLYLRISQKGVARKEQKTAHHVV